MVSLVYSLVVVCPRLSPYDARRPRMQVP
uniref:Uncharacterized protein n=1 Tax=Arundo donax TaxID=35708 RepID=A0A0A9AZ71_ARUDO